MSVVVDVDPENTLPFPDDEFSITDDLFLAVQGAIKTLELMECHGVNIPEPDESTKNVARGIFKGDVTAANLNQLNLASTKHLRTLLTAYDERIIVDAEQLRTYITNKLIEETGHKDARVRLKALELLGRTSDVGLFTDKSEITYKHAPTPELEARLRDKLEKLYKKDVVDVDYKDINLDASQELGM